VEAAEALTLGRIGRALDRVELPSVEVRLPRDLADAAAAARARDDVDEVSETAEQRVARHRMSPFRWTPG